MHMGIDPSMQALYRILAAKHPVTEETTILFEVRGYMPRFPIGVANSNKPYDIFHLQNVWTRDGGRYAGRGQRKYFLYCNIGAYGEFAEDPRFLLNHQSLSQQRLLRLPSWCSGYQEHTFG